MVGVKRKKDNVSYSKVKKFRAGRCCNCLLKNCLSLQDNQYKCGKI